MALTPGSRLGVYEVTEQIGAGGMGEVYRATDSNLKRSVAIKVLPASVAGDADRLARFQREAEVLAALNHPNIGAIYGLEKTPDFTALVMELVEGEDLSQRIQRGAIPLDEALPIAKQIADALEAAHEQGIIHRDLKPANIKVRSDGTVKVLDFGLAKAIDPAGASSANAMNSPTLSMHATQAGVILGTAAYMSPEQARGKAVDKRADIWAFGVILFEMLAGRRAFAGDDISEVLATVLKSEPEWAALSAETPTSIRRLLRRCLEKDPRKRLSAIGDARLELDETEPSPATVMHPPHAARRSVSLSTAAGALVIAVVAAAGLMRSFTRSVTQTGVGGVTRLSMPLPDGDEVTEMAMVPLAISPDGARIAYVAIHDGVQRVFLRSLADADATPVIGSEGGRSPFFSPDGQWIGFFATGKMKKAAVTGGAVQVIAENALDSRGGTWSADGTIYFAPTGASGLWRVPAAGGTPIELTQVDHPRGEISHRWPQVTPDGKTLLFTIWTGPGPDEHVIVTQDLATGERHSIIPGGDSVRYVPAGYLAYSRLDALLAVRWRPGSAKIASSVPISLPEFARMENEGGAAYAVSSTGTLAHIRGGPTRYVQRLVWVDSATGAAEALPLPDRDYEAVALSPDRQRAVVQVREGTIGLWLYDFTRHTLTPFATTSGSSQAAIWTPDGRRIIYRGTRNGSRHIYWKAADGSGEEERLTDAEGIQTPTSVSPDGESLVFNGGGVISVSLMRLQHDRTPRLLVPGASNAQISPDGRWLSYDSALSGRDEVYLTPFPGPGPRVPVSADGGADSRWSRDGRELFYTRGGKMMAVAIASGSTMPVGASRVLYDGRYRRSPNLITGWDVSADGRRFLRVQQVQPDQPVTRIDVVLDWLSEFRPPTGR